MSNFEIGDVIAESRDHPGDLKAEGCAGSLRWRVQAGGLKQIGTVHPGGGDLYQNLARTGSGIWYVEP